MERRVQPSILVFVLVLVLVTGSCNSSKPDPSSNGARGTPATSSSPTPSPVEADIEDDGQLAVGTYTAAKFRPRFSFKIDAPGWYAGFPTRSFQPMNVFPDHPEWYLVFLQLEKVYDPLSNHPKAAPPPRDLVSWFEEHPQFETTPPEKVTVGGVKFAAFDADVVKPRSRCEWAEGAPCVLVATNHGDSPIHYLEGTHVRIFIHQAGTRTLFISIEAPEAEFDLFDPSAEDLLQSVQFLDPL